MTAVVRRVTARPVVRCRTAVFFQPVGRSSPIQTALFLPPAQPVPLNALTGALLAAQKQFTAVRYTALRRGLPRLIATAEATRDETTGRHRERAHALLARCYILATELATEEHSTVAWVSADRALSSARMSGDAHAISEAARALAITMRRAGRAPGAVDLLTRTASSFDTAGANPSARPGFHPTRSRSGRQPSRRHRPSA